MNAEMIEQNDIEPLIHFLAEAGKWSDFAWSLNKFYIKHGYLTEKQEAAARRMQAKCEANSREAKPYADLDSHGLDRIKELFETAMSNGLKCPRFYIDDLCISRAPDNGRNKGHLYVKRDGHYQGKVTPEGKFQPVRDADSDIDERLVNIAHDPLEAAINHGKQAGSCACCGRELTDPESVERGIGPVCAKNWGFE